MLVSSVGLPGSASLRGRCPERCGLHELVQQIPDGHPAAPVETDTSFDDHPLEGLLSLRPSSTDRARQSASLARDKVRVDGHLKPPASRSTIDHRACSRFGHPPRLVYVSKGTRMAREICLVDANGEVRQPTGAMLNGTEWHGKVIRPVDPTAGASP